MFRGGARITVVRNLMTTLQKAAGAFPDVTDPAPTSFVDARVMLQWAAQVVGDAGNTLAPPADDTGHSAMRYQPYHRLLATVPLAGAAERVALDVVGYRWVVLDEAGTEVAAIGIADSTLARGKDFVRQTLTSARGGAAIPELVSPDFELPGHAIGHGALFAAPPPAQREVIDRWFRGAHGLLSVFGQRPDASEVRCWPHHFDIATLITLDPDQPDAEKARSIGVGLSPGDEIHDEPYFYVTPWPYPPVGSLPALGVGGAWVTEGWVGALLTATAMLEHGGGEAAAAFLASAVEASEGLLGG